MVNITITKECIHETQTMVDITIQGHANSDVYGKDVVCAGVSTVTYGFMNYLNFLYSNQQIKMKDEKGDVEMKFYYYDNDKRIQGALDLFVISMETLANTFIDYINLKSNILI